LVRPLFVYATLRDPELLAAVLGRQLAAGEMLAAVAPGFRGSSRCAARPFGRPGE
jgi:hypothetical protein